MGKAMTRIVKVIEFLKKVLNNLHLCIEIVNVPVTEIYEPKFEGLV